MAMQGGLDRTEARVDLTLGSLQGRVSGVVTGDGHLTLDGVGLDGTANGVNVRVTIDGWDTSLDGHTVMVGRWTQSLAATGAAGRANMENEIVTMNRTTE
jgi:hypothetical protein